MKKVKLLIKNKIWLAETSLVLDGHLTHSERIELLVKLDKLKKLKARFNKKNKKHKISTLITRRERLVSTCRPFSNDEEFIKLGISLNDLFENMTEDLGSGRKYLYKDINGTLEIIVEYDFLVINKLTIVKYK